MGPHLERGLAPFLLLAAAAAVRRLPFRNFLLDLEDGERERDLLALLAVAAAAAVGLFRRLRRLVLLGDLTDLAVLMGQNCFTLMSKFIIMFVDCFMRKCFDFLQLPQ